MSLSIEELDHTIEMLNSEEYAAAIGYFLIIKGKKLPKITIRQDDDDIDMNMDHIDEPDQSLHSLYLLQVSGFLQTLKQISVDAREIPKLRDLVKLAVHVGIACDQTIRLVYPLRRLILLWQTSKFESTHITHANKYAITPFHGPFALSCLHAKAYHAALCILDQPIFEVAMPSALQSVQVLEYFYYGGMLYTGLKRFREACDFFLTAIATPAQSLSAIVIESYKKYILVSILAEGEVPALPKNVALVVSRGIESHVAPYIAFAKAIKSLNMLQVTETAQAITSDIGLVKQCLEALKRHRVQQMTKMYTKVSLAKIAKEITSTSIVAESCVLDMIESDSVAASIEKVNDMIVFDSNDVVDDTKMHRMLEETILYTNRLQEIDVVLTKNPKYIGKTKDKRGSKFSDGEDASSWQSTTQP